MKKKVFIAMAVAAAMAAMPVAAGAAGSSHDSSSSSSSSSTTTSNSGATSNAGVASGATVVSSQPTVQVTESGAKVTVAGATKDATGTTIGLVGESAGNGAVKSGDVTVGVATGAAETAGLPDATVSTIKALNSSASLSSVLPGLGLEAFAKVGGTRAIVAKERSRSGCSDRSIYVRRQAAGKRNRNRCVLQQRNRSVDDHYQRNRRCSNQDRKLYGSRFLHRSDRCKIISSV